MAERTRRPLKSVDDVILNILDDLKWPTQMELPLVKTIFYGPVNNYMQYDPRDFVPKEQIYKEICRVLELAGYKHHIHDKREWWQKPINKYKK